MSSLGGDFGILRNSNPSLRKASFARSFIRRRPDRDIQPSPHAARQADRLTLRTGLSLVLAQLRSRSSIIDGEAVACGNDGIALFERSRGGRRALNEHIEADGSSIDSQARPAIGV